MRIDELCDPRRTLHIDSRVLDEAEAAEEPIAEINGEQGGQNMYDGPPRKLTRKQQAELLRLQVDTVGQSGKPGEQIQNVISVGMLSEGWDAKTVTHIMGLRAFTSQLLCEQVVGRGLRRTSYEINPDTGLFEAEHVNIFRCSFYFPAARIRGRRNPGTAQAKDGNRASRGEGCLRDQLAQHHPHRPCLPASSVP